MPPVFLCLAGGSGVPLASLRCEENALVWVSSASPKRVGCVVRLSPMRPPLTRRADGVMME